MEMPTGIKKQVIDQSAHFVIGLIVARVLSGVVPGWEIPIVLAMALIREIAQHWPDRPGKGSLLDLLFWLAGAVVGISLPDVLI